MRKPSAANVLAKPPVQNWEYASTSSRKEMESLGKQGWEAFAVVGQEHIRNYYLKRALK